MLTITIDRHPCHYEVQALCTLFLGGEAVRVEEGDALRGGRAVYTGAAQTPRGAELTARVRLNGPVREETCLLPSGGARESAREMERAFGRMLYRMLCAETGIIPPWGILTGVRPVRLFLERMADGDTDAQLAAHFGGELFVSPEKIALACETARVQLPILADDAPGRVMLYVSIPFCPSRCRYCSFVSHSIAQAGHLVEPYVELLCAELAELGEIAARRGLVVDSVYFGGGTPTSLEARHLRRIFAAAASSFTLTPGAEYTVEAGRPDTVTPERLEALREAGVGRVSINPQTMQDPVLALAGRPHTAADTVAAYRLAREYGFSTINMDLIAGLEGDSPAGFADSLARVLALGPENVTVHTLCVKRAADLGAHGPDVLARGGVGRMLAGADRALHGAGLRPYYLYRQKNTVENLENVGYSLPGHENAYNVRIMDESRTILAAGAGGVTKLVRPAPSGAGRKYAISRIFNYKYPYEYISRFDTLRQRRAAIDRFYGER